MEMFHKKQNCRKSDENESYLPVELFPDRDREVGVFTLTEESVEQTGRYLHLVVMATKYWLEKYFIVSPNPA